MTHQVDQIALRANLYKCDLNGRLSPFSNFDRNFGILLGFNVCRGEMGAYMFVAHNHMTSGDEDLLLVVQVWNDNLAIIDRALGR